jgi:hypothetical protein
MRNGPAVIAALVFCARAALAQGTTTIDNLQPTPLPMTGAEEAPVWQATGPTNTRKATVANILATANPAAKVTGGTIDNTTIGGTTPAAGTFTTDTVTGSSIPGSGAGLYLPAPNALGFFGAGAETAHWDNSGHLIFGCPACTSTAQPQYFLDLRNSVSGSPSGIRVFNPNATSGTIAELTLATGTANAFSNFFVQDGATPTAEWSIGSGVTGGIVINPSVVGNVSIGIPPTGNLSVNSAGNGPSFVVVGTNAAIANKISITAAATAGAPQILASGSDTNVSMLLAGQGTGIVRLNGFAAATASSGAATANGQRVQITSESLTTAAGSDYVLTLTNSFITAPGGSGSLVMCSVANGTNTTEGLACNRVQPGSGSAVIHIRNTNASSVLNGTIVISVVVF